MAATVSGGSAPSSRRAQIVDATIETVAELGFARTTFARIADRGGLSSTRLISYHFESKAALMEAVVADIYRSIDEFMVDRAAVDAASRPVRQPEGRPAPAPEGTAAQELRAYITGTVAYVDAYRSRMRALQSIFAAVHDDARNPAVVQADPDGAVMRHLQDILRRGQDRGEFRAFEPVVIAALIQRSLEGLTQLLHSRPELDLEQYAAELVTAVDLATRSPSQG